MSYLFDRRASITLFPVLIEKDSSGAIVTKKLEKKGRRLDGLTIEFEITKSHLAEPNTAKIDVYNFNESSRGLIESKQVKVLLEVGYQENTGVLFYGDVSKAVNEKRGPDWITKMELGDGEQSFRKATINKSYSAGTSIKTIISDLVKQLGTGIGVIRDIDDETLQQGYSASGSAAKILTDFVKKQGLEWSIQEGNLNILSPKKDIGNVAYFLGPATGLIGTPSKKDSGEIEFTCLINPQIKPLSKVLISSGKVFGYYRVNKCEYKGNSKSGNWEMKCEAVSIG